MTARALAASALAALLTLGGAGGCAYIETKQRELIFRPVREIHATPADRGMAYEDVWIRVAGGDAGEAKIHGWFVPAARKAPAGGGPPPAVLYLHGVRWSLSGHLFRIARWREMGFDVLAIDYRGFGRSDGDLPSEAQTYADAQAAWEWLKARVPDASRRVVYGHSLGGAVAIELASRNADVAALVVESSFTSMQAMAARQGYGFLPVSLVLTERYDSLARIAAVRAPVLFVHGTGDGFVPPEMSEALYAAANEPKRLLLVEGASHSNASGYAFERYAAAVREIVAVGSGTHRACREAAPASC
ncbi:MAG: lysophospholipase [Burkholderiales bacterium]|nr:lysophospholipase [Burkholderiales bacterium]